jgi:hypothetical protein
MAISNTVTNLNEIVTILKNMGDKWEPVSPKLQIPFLEARCLAGQTMLDDMQSAIVFDNLKTKERATAFAPLNNLVRRVVAAADSCDMDETTVEKAYSIKNLIDGTNVGQANSRRKKSLEKAKTLLSEGETLPETPKARSVSKQAYDKRLENFKLLINLLTQAGNYATNQADLKLPALTAFAETLAAASEATDNAYKMLEIKREERNELISVEGNSGLTVKKVTAFEFVKLVD